MAGNPSPTGRTWVVFFAGVGLGLTALRQGWATLTKYDHRSLEEIFTGKNAEQRQERLRAAETEAEGEAGRVDATLDPLVMTVTARQLTRWTELAQTQVVSPPDAAVIEAGGEEGERKKFELLYARSFMTLGFSFHRSLADYYGRVSGGKLWPHESRALVNLLRMVEEDFAVMVRVVFVKADLAALRDEERLAALFRNVGR